MRNSTTDKGPEISIVVPVYNAASFLDDCIRSVLNQTFPSFELILIDDASTDNSLEICKRACESDDRIHWLTCVRNQGPSHARNMGIDAARGKYLFFLDSDDMIHPQLLEKMWQKAEKMSADLTVSDFFRLDQNSLKKWESLCNDVLNTKWLLFADNNDALEHWFGLKTWRSTWGKLFLKEAVGSLRFDESISFTEDILFNYLFLLEKPRRLLVTDALGYCYRIREESLCHLWTEDMLSVYQNTSQYMRDSESQLGRDENAVILEQFYLSQLRLLLCQDKNLTRETQAKIKLQLDTERHSPMFQKISMYHKCLFYLCWYCMPFYRLLRSLKQRILNRS